MLITYQWASLLVSLAITLLGFASCRLNAHRRPHHWVWIIFGLSGAWFYSEVLIFHPDSPEGTWTTASAILRMFQSSLLGWVLGFQVLGNLISRKKHG